MQLKYFFISFLLSAAGANAQRVHRKGVQPIDVSKNKKQNSTQANFFTVAQFDGKWQEVNRTGQDKKVLAIKDTILLNFTKEGKAITREGNQPNIVGTAEIEQPGNILLVAADVYTILSVSEKQIVLLDEQESVIHTLNKTDQFYYETFGKLSVTQDIYTNPLAVSLSAIMGKWSVYRKQAKPGAINPPTNIIEYLYITQKITNSTAKGEITFYQKEKSEAMPCSIKVTDAGIEITAGIYNWSLSVYKADGKEFIFGNADVLMYYAKPL